jgi:sulfur carrier protein ThiS
MASSGQASARDRRRGLAAAAFGRRQPRAPEEAMKLIYRDREWELEGRMTVRQAIEKVGLIPETVLAVRDGKLLTEDTVLEPADTVKLVSVVSGG